MPLVEGTGKWWTFSSLCRAPGFAITFMENPLVGLLGGMELVSEQTTLQIRLLVLLPKTASVNTALLFLEYFF